MKNQLTLAFTLFVCYYISAQDKTIHENWYNGSLKKHLVLRGNDTLYFEYGYENGQTALKRWGKDSAYIFGYEGSIWEKHFGNVQLSYWQYSGDSSIHYDNMGRRESILIKGKTDIYDVDTLIFSSYAKDNKYEFRHSDGKLWVKRSGDIKTYDVKDTIYNTKGRIQAIIHHNVILTQNPYKLCKLYNDNGEILYASEGENILTLEKDNSQCLYGFRNSKREWAIPPQYENVQELGLQYFIASTADNAVLFNQKGEKIEGTECEFLGKLDSRTFCHSAPTNGQTNQYIEYPDLAYKNILINIDYENSILLKFRKNGRYGVMDIKGNIVLHPQYQNVRKHELGLFEVKIGDKWGIVDASGNIKVLPNYTEVAFTNNPQVFITSDTSSLIGSIYKITKNGLVNDKSQTLLPNQNYGITSLDNGNFYIQNGYHHYLFSAQKGFLVDTSFTLDWLIFNTFYKVYNPKTKLTGIINKEGETVIPIQYLDIKPMDYYQNEGHNLYFLKTKEGKYGIFNTIKKDWILQPSLENIGYVPTFVGNRRANDEPLGNIKEAYRTPMIAIKKQGKWRILKADLTSVSKLEGEFDYFGYENDNVNNDGENFIFLVKDKKLRFYTARSLPLITDFRSNYDFTKKQIFSLKTVEGTELLFNKNGDLLASPQYKIKSYVGEYVILNDTITNKQKLLSPDGTVKDFLPQYNVLKAHIAHDAVVVEDPKTKLLGVVNIEGKVIVPVDNFAAVIDETDKVVWIRYDFPNIPKDSFLYYNEFDLNALDSNWVLHDLKGKPLTTTTFKKPFNFYNSLGIGIFNDKMGLWSDKGEVIIPPQYKYILRDTIDNFYYLARQNADSTLTYGFADSTGCIVKEANWTMMSRFYGNYAFIMSNGQKGVIDKKGNYLCPLLPHSISNFKGSLVDSFLKKELNDSSYQIYSSSLKRNTQVIFNNIWDKKAIFKLSKESSSLIERYFDSLSTEKQRVLMNCVLDAMITSYSLPKSSFYHERLSDSLNISPLFLDNIFQGTQEMNIMHRSKKMVYDGVTIYGNNHYSNEHITLNEFNVSGRYVNLLLSNAKMGYAQNYYLKNGIWRILNIEDVIELTAANISKLNTLLSTKIKALKNEDLYCSSGLSFFDLGSQLCYINDKGLVFQYPRKINQNEYYYFEKRIVPITLTWEELQPFIKMKP